MPRMLWFRVLSRLAVAWHMPEHRRNSLHWQHQAQLVRPVCSQLESRCHQCQQWMHAGVTCACIHWCRCVRCLFVSADWAAWAVAVLPVLATLRDEWHEQVIGSVCNNVCLYYRSVASGPLAVVMDEPGSLRLSGRQTATAYCCYADSRLSRHRLLDFGIGLGQ